MKKTIIREIAPGGGSVTPWTLISKTAKVIPPAEAYDSAEILDRAEVSGRSVVRNYAKVMDEAVVQDSVVLDHARIGGYARALRAEVSGTSDIRGMSVVKDSKVTGNAIIAGSWVGYPLVEDSEVGCNARVLDQAKLYNVLMRGDINDTYIIAGDAELNFPVPMELYPGTRVERGVWTRPPLVIDTPFHATVEDVGNKVRIGCLSFSLSFWFSNGKTLLRQYGVDEDLYQNWFEAMERMRDFKKEFGSPSVRSKQE